MHAAMTSPVSDIFVAALQAMSMSEASLFMADEQRERILRAIVENYYCHHVEGGIVFDTSRIWSAHTAALARLFPEARIICCVRNPAWIVDSIERLIRRNPLLVSRMFGAEIGTANIYLRAEALMKPGGLLSWALQSLQQAWFGDEAERLIAVEYDSLTERPADTIHRLYEALGAPVFGHDFDNLEYDAPDFDARLNMPGLHRIATRVARVERQTILPPEVFNQLDSCFWSNTDQNTRNVIIL